MPGDREKGQRRQQLAHGQHAQMEGEKMLPGFEVHFRGKEETEEDDQCVDGHDDGRAALNDEIEGAVMRPYHEAFRAKTLLSRHYHAPNSLRPNTTVRARLTPKTIPADFCIDAFSVPICRSNTR